MSISNNLGTAESEQTLKREFTLWSSFAFAFAYISPIVALYGIFGLAYATAGPGFWWNFLIVFGGQLMVAFVFAECVSRFPIEGSIYQWASQLIGKGWGWMAGWLYTWTIVVAMATVAIGAGGFVARVFNQDATATVFTLGSLNVTKQVGFSLIILVLGTLANITGRQVLKVLMTASIAAEFLGSIGLGLLLLIGHRNNDLSVLTDGFSTDNYLSLSGPFLVTMAFVGFSFVGFESAGSIAEEVKDPRRTLPKAVILSLSIVALVVIFSSLSIILSIPADIAANSADPVYDTLKVELGTGAAKFAEVLFTVGFLASFLALQTSGSRIMWAFARDKALPGHHTLAKLSAGQKQPVAALILATTIAAIMMILSQVTPDFFTLMLNFTTGGFFLAFLFPLAGAFLTHVRGKWTPGPFNFGRGSAFISTISLVWAVFMFVNISWPRDIYPDKPYLNWSVVIAAAGLILIGSVIYLVLRPGMTSVDMDRIAASEIE